MDIIGYHTGKEYEDLLSLIAGTPESASNIHRTHPEVAYTQRLVLNQVIEAVNRAGVRNSQLHPKDKFGPNGLVSLTHTSHLNEAVCVHTFRPSNDQGKSIYTEDIIHRSPSNNWQARRTWDFHHGFSQGRDEIVSTALIGAHALITTTYSNQDGFEEEIDVHLNHASAGNNNRYTSENTEFSLVNDELIIDFHDHMNTTEGCWEHRRRGNIIMMKESEGARPFSTDLTIVEQERKAGKITFTNASAQNGYVRNILTIEDIDRRGNPLIVSFQDVRGRKNIQRTDTFEWTYV